jgi:hypothetical protein
VEKSLLLEFVAFLSSQIEFPFTTCFGYAQTSGSTGGKIPKEVVTEDKTTVEQMRLIQQSDEEDKQTIFLLIEKMLTKKKFKEFFQKNVAAL